MYNPNDHVLDLVDDYLHDVLTPARARAVETHCERCRICKAALEEAVKRRAALEAVAACEAPEHLVRSTLHRIDTYAKTPRRARKLTAWALLAATAASVALLGGLHLHFANLTATPYDLKVFGQTQLLAGTTASVRVQLLHDPRGAAFAGVPVDIELRDQRTDQVVQLAHFTTNAQGTGQPRFQLPDWADGPCELRVTAHPDGAPEVISQTVQLKRSWKVMLTSDKPVYQPGQTIRLRSLALRRPDLKPVAGSEVTFSVADPKGNIIFKRHDVTSNYGIAAADCPLATEILEGPYAITCNVGDTESKLTVDVHKYVLPKFKINVELDQPFYQPGQRVKGKVHAEYFFAKPVAGAAVNMDVQFNFLAADQKLDASRTDPAGDVSFEIVLPESLARRQQDAADARFTLNVTLNDTAGQKQTKSVSRLVTVNAIHVEVIPEAGTLVPDVANRIFLFASYPDGRPARARLAVSGFPQELTSNSLGVASFQITPNSRERDFTIRATDEEGRSGHRQVRLSEGSVHPDFLVRPDKAVYNGGDTMHLVALGSGTQPIFVDLVKDGQTLLTETIDMVGGRGEYRIDLLPELFGTVELCAYRFDGGGMPVRKTRTLYIRPARELTIKSTLDQAEYRPGKRAKVQLALTDSQGRPARGAISLAAVDEAVFSVLDQAPSIERTLFTLEQELLRPVHAVYPWAPELFAGTVAEERNLFEQALFSCTARTWRGPDRGASATHSLFASSYTMKDQEVAAVKATALGHVRAGWVMLGIAILVVGIVVVGIVIAALLRRILLECVVVIGILVILVGLLLPATQEVREAAPRSAAKFAQVAGQASEAYKNSLQERPQVLGNDGDPIVATPPPVRVREWFPETLLWRPELITDDTGHASLDVDLADSITTWRLTASAVAADGRLGAAQSSIRVFQPFFVDLNLPVALTRGDEVAVPVVVYNYLDKPQTVELSLGDAAWFERLEDGTKRLDLQAGEVRSASYRIRVRKVGNHQLQVTARGSGVADGLKRDIEVVPDGRRVEQVASGTLQQPVEMTLTVPEAAIEGSPKAFLKIYPSTFSQLVEGLDGIFRMPYGCFEQTSSTTYPNILALDYLRTTKKSVPEVEAKARQYIHLGYQRLLGFEVSGGGFDWFGRPPANRTLTAYGLMEFQDMARVHDVDPRLIERTRKWLLAQRQADGSWPPEGHALHEDVARGERGSETARLSTTAYIAWAVFAGQPASNEARVTLNYLLAHEPSTVSDPYVLALLCNALLALDPDRGKVAPYLQRLESLKRTSQDGKRIWWEQAADARTSFYGSGRSGSVETTALAILALLQADAGPSPATVRGALSWLVEQKDASGTWHSTQATVLALKALLAGSSRSPGSDRERRIELSWDGGKKRDLLIPADQTDVMQQFDLSDQLSAGVHRLTLTERSNTAAGYQVAFRYHVPEGDGREPRESLTLEVGFDRKELAIGDTVTATATLVNHGTQTAPMVVVELPIPAGFALAADDLAGLVTAGTVAKYQLNARTAVLYLRGLEPGKRLELRYHLRALLLVKVTVPAARVYEYYNPERQGRSLPAHLAVTR